MSEGISGDDLSLQDLDRELAHLHVKRHEIFVEGTAHQWRNHLHRTDELESAYLRRFADRVAESAAKQLGQPKVRPSRPT